MTAISKAIVEELAQNLTREDCEKIQENIDSIPGATWLDKVSSEQICGGINVLNAVQKWAPTGLGAVAVIMAALSLRQSGVARAAVVANLKDITDIDERVEKVEKWKNDWHDDLIDMYDEYWDRTHPGDGEK